MKKASLQTKIYLGVFALVIATVGAVAVLVLGDGAAIFRHTNRYTARFTNAAGLVTGAPVRMGGVAVGRVTDIAIESNTGTPVVKATLAIDQPYAEMLRLDASVTLDTQGVLGDKFVALSVGTDAETLPDGAPITTSESNSLAKAVEKSTVILDDVGRTTQSLDRFASGLPDGAELQAISNDLASSAKALRSITQKLADDGSVVSALRDPQAAADLRAGLKSFAAAAANAESITRKINEGQGTFGALVNDRSMYEDLREWLGHADRGRVARRVFREASRDVDTATDASNIAH